MADTDTGSELALAAASVAMVAAPSRGGCSPPPPGAGGRLVMGATTGDEPDADGASVMAREGATGKTESAAGPALMRELAPSSPAAGSASTSVGAGLPAT
jgi:hypothetical protein